MSTEVSLLSLLPVASFAIAAGALAVRLFVPSGPAKQTLITAALIFLLLTSGLLWQQQREETRRIRVAADEIVTVIGNEKRTYDEILSGLRLPSYRIANAALDLLVGEKRVGSEAASIIDKSNNSFRIRLYFVRTF
jgi:hypothetical protein